MKPERLTIAENIMTENLNQSHENEEIVQSLKTFGVKAQNSKLKPKRSRYYIQFFTSKTFTDLVIGICRKANQLKSV